MDIFFLSSEAVSSVFSASDAVKVDSETMLGGSNLSYSVFTAFCP